MRSSNHRRKWMRSFTRFDKERQCWCRRLHRMWHRHCWRKQATRTSMSQKLYSSSTMPTITSQEKLDAKQLSNFGWVTCECCGPVGRNLTWPRFWWRLCILWSRVQSKGCNIERSRPRSGATKYESEHRSSYTMWFLVLGGGRSPSFLLKGCNVVKDEWFLTIVSCIRRFHSIWTMVLWWYIPQCNIIYMDE